MTYVYYNVTSERLGTDTFNKLLQQLPPFIQGQILKYRNWQDRQRSLIGKALLIEGLKSLGLNTSYSLSNLKFTQFKRPYFDDHIDFNISHSGAYTICAISKTNKIGIDVEEIREIPIAGFEDQFSERELDEILQAENSLRAFYVLWTQKEAFLKGIGTGLHIPLNKISISNKKILWQDKTWYLHELQLDHRYTAYLSADISLQGISLNEVYFH
ncbi:4'-phosphopantetheinyl transferase superfamily protein [Chitinophagaceae bacterium LB-8]|uniref:4'-phosphopantetheinyl transferase superfamily protein n=1 Tax=Paraflavisolibacter caeni TaxID=2982496 RepID=A0A9X2Y112_9BACT|nr:4'-phosphopantetheinyl transferase superfamily protein [Paraflavisolibacter caeni]MCU7552751.1 4'-phosphopantetheinyl transferase superfamily protein [Paraflavisolibacter caeni]